MNIVQGNVICSECSDVVFAIHAFPGRFVCSQCDRGVHSLRWVWLCNEDGSRWEADSRAGGTFVISVCSDGTFDLEASNCSLPLQWGATYQTLRDAKAYAQRIENDLDW